MNIKTTIPISEARKNIFKIAEQVQKPGVYFTFTEKGKPKGVIMSAEEFESWTETMEVMQQFPNLYKDIAEADRAVRTGDFSDCTSLEELEGEYGFDKRLKSQTKNDISGIRRKKSSKKDR
jgi:prevent-host-death family protein